MGVLGRAFSVALAKSLCASSPPFPILQNEQVWVGRGRGAAGSFSHWNPTSEKSDFSSHEGPGGSDVGCPWALRPSYLSLS